MVFFETKGGKNFIKSPSVTNVTPGTTYNWTWYDVNYDGTIFLMMSETTNGTVISKDAGFSWTSILTGAGNAGITGGLNNDGSLIAIQIPNPSGQSVGYFKISTDGGSTFSNATNFGQLPWASVGVGKTTNRIHAIWLSQGIDRTGNSKNNTYKYSDNNGATVSVVNTNGMWWFGKASRWTSVSNQLALYISLSQNLIYRFSASGGSGGVIIGNPGYNSIPPALDAACSKALTVNSTVDGSYTGDLVYSSNGGANWSSLTTGFSVVNKPSSVEVSQDGSYLYCIRSSNGAIYYSKDSGVTWNILNSSYNFRALKANYLGDVVYGITTTNQVIRIANFAY